MPDVNAYDNLILLCSRHHKQVDDQVQYFTVARLKGIKGHHEAWVAGLDTGRNLGPVRLVPDPMRPVAKVLRIFTTGSALWYFVDGSEAFYPTWPGGLGDENEDMIASFCDDLRDWLDVAGGPLESFRAKRDASRALGEHIKRLAEAGFLIGARERFCLLVGGTAPEPSTRRVIDIEIQPAAVARVVDADGRSLDNS